MKKIISIALVALFVAITAFAGFTGDASLSLGYNFKDSSYGFSNDNSVNVNLDLSSETAEAVGEGRLLLVSRLHSLSRLQIKREVKVALFGLMHQVKKLVLVHFSV